MNTITLTEITEETFIGLLNTLLMRGYDAYQNYLHHDKTFLYAKVIKSNNDLTLQLILSYCHLLPKQHQPDLIKFASHLDVWICQWNDLYERKNPHLTDTFIFETAVGFPKEALDRLDAYFNSKAKC